MRSVASLRRSRVVCAPLKKGRVRVGMHDTRPAAALRGETAANTSCFGVREAYDSGAVALPPFSLPSLTVRLSPAFAIHEKPHGPVRPQPSLHLSEKSPV